MNEYYRNTIIEINLDNIKDNINEIKQKCSKDKFLFAVIKGDAYGHGIKQIADIVVQSKADACAVATLDEALVVRKCHKDIKILCLGIIPEEYYEIACDNEITITVANNNSIEALKKAKLKKEIKVHLKVNSGMNRIGFNNIENLKNSINELKKINNVLIDGIFTHFATAEDYDKEDYFIMQLNFFKEIVEKLNYEFNFIHCTNSASLLKFHDKINFTNANRCGIAMYAALEDKILEKYNIKKAFKLKSKINQVQVYKKGTSVGYSCQYTTLEDNEIIATIPIGYADGFSKAFKNTVVRCNNQYGIMVGGICMDQLMIKFDKMVNIGDEVILIDDDKKIDFFTRAKQANTITHEIITGFNIRVPRIYIYNNEIIKVDNTLLDK